MRMRTLYKTAVSTFAIWLLFISVAFADAAPGDEIVTLGDDLSPQQRETLLNEMNVNEDEVLIVTVTNEEEHQYLGDYISASVIGSNALSSSKITLLDQGEGVDVETNRITWVSEGMYANALITAGVKDANIYVTAPFNVSGTGALTGLIKAYEASTDEVIPEDQKQVANEELVKTAELSDEYGVEDATELMARIKEALAEENIETEEDLRALIQRIAGELGMTLTDEELNGLVSLFNRMKDLNIDWDQVQNQIGKIRENIGDFLNSEEGQGFIQSILDFISNLIDIVKGWFSS
ncbi:DUF1002 domain-containing protein [Salipaludibacillus agaradhaerens]|uniref:DUF1002 domain-containing protein n=2 Tax=Salipaludibacillus agaradhaerens TaxID=76935 RepID=A0A9Q4B1S7_SALAG|nr:DUF1002 domain-containing protein [Salipaludibacillus agaradhaerens]MCR6113697.1 DUF1002 domain-containing protein [Salipaludibacillus agaradhaerens]